MEWRKGDRTSLTSPYHFVWKGNIVKRHFLIYARSEINEWQSQHTTTMKKDKYESICVCAYEFVSVCVCARACNTEIRLTTLTWLDHQQAAHILHTFSHLRREIRSNGWRLFFFACFAIFVLKWSCVRCTMYVCVWNMYRKARGQDHSHVYEKIKPY